MRPDFCVKATSCEPPWLVALDEHLPAAWYAHIGGKARSLLRLRALGLPTPVAYASATALLPRLLPQTFTMPRVLDADGVAHLQALARGAAARPLPDGMRRALAEAIAALDRAWQAARPANGDDEDSARHGGSLRHSGFSVRSSFAHEDDPRRLAPGVYASRIGVTADEVALAVAQVLASAVDVPAVAYARARGEDPMTGPHAILLHRTVVGHAHGHALWTGTAPTKIETRSGVLAPDEHERLSVLLSTAAQRTGHTSAFETEWVATSTGFVFLQWRPWAKPGRPAASATARARHRRWPEGWHWDAAHNPLPLSPAQASLVARMDALAILPIEQRVFGGYLFWRQRPGHMVATVRSVPDAQVLATAIVRERNALPEPPTLSDALAFFTRHYATIVGGLSTSARAGRHALATFLTRHLPPARAEATLIALLARVPSLASARAQALARLALADSASEREAALAAFLARFGDESSVWDVAYPTRRETPQDLLASAAHLRRKAAAHADGEDPGRVRQQILAQLPTALHDEFLHLVHAARAAAALGEDDDGLYALIQAPVRAALLRLGRQLLRLGALATAEDIFFLPLDIALSLEDSLPAQTPSPSQSTTLRRIAASARARYARALRKPPPLPVPAQHVHKSGPAGDGLWRGQGTYGRAVGTVVHHRPDTGAPRTLPNDAILVATSILPTELPLLDARAIVTEVGGVLDHVAAQCRARGLPAVVGVPGAVAGLPEGKQVLVDADAGFVVVLENVHLPTPVRSC